MKCSQEWHQRGCHDIGSISETATQQRVGAVKNDIKVLYSDPLSSVKSWLLKRYQF